LSRRWWIIPALVALLAAVGFAYWGYGLNRDRDQLVTLMNNRNQKSYFELVSSVQNMEVMLSKGIVSNSPGQRMLIFADIWQQASQAQNDLNQIPMSGASMNRTTKFLTQTGDYAWSLARKYARGDSVKPSEIRELNALHTEAGYLAVELQRLADLRNIGRLSWGELRRAADRELADQSSPTLLGMQKIDKNMEDFPSLIYDGPFSDHIMTRIPKALTGSLINDAQASGIAERFVEAGTGDNYRVVKTEGVNGIIPAFRLHLQPQGAKTPAVIADISKTGGHPLMMLSTRPVNRTSINKDRAVSIASDFLANRGIRNMKPTYMVEQNNTGVVIFEYVQDGVLVYPDLMKVKVALDNGDVVGFEGTGFIMNHSVRENTKPAVSEKEALRAVNPQLKIKSRRLAIIPMENLKEVLAYEFKGDLNGDIFIVYINAKTGKEERILKVIETRGGAVTM